MSREHLDAMGIQRWKMRVPTGQEPAALVPRDLSAAPIAPSPGQESSTDWQSLQDEVAACERCALSQTRTNTVFGSGNDKASWLFVGEAPGAEEDRQGLPFVGRAGKLLNAIIESIGMSRDEVFIANVLKCRPPGNRDPLGEEVSQCHRYLAAQLRHIQPDIIIALGAFAARALLHTEEPIGRLRGRTYEYGEEKIPLVITYHPAYLLRSPLEKEKVWEDLKLALQLMRNT